MGLLYKEEQNLDLSGEAKIMTICQCYLSPFVPSPSWIFKWFYMIHEQQGPLFLGDVSPSCPPPPPKVDGGCVCRAGVGGQVPQEDVETPAHRGFNATHPGHLELAKLKMFNSHQPSTGGWQPPVCVAFSRPPESHGLHLFCFS